VNYVDRSCGLIYVAIPTEKTVIDLKQDNQFSVREVDLRFTESVARVQTIRRQISTGAH
jgi:hypothetical protein